jgi:AraC family ethanolamine operon transcriptional activator
MLKIRDFDELAPAFPGWDLRVRQLGHGAFQGEIQLLQLEGIQVFRLAVNRRVHIWGWPPPGSFGCAPVLAPNENAVWRGRHLKAGQVRVLVPGQGADHVTAAENYQLVALAVDGNLVRQGAPVLGGFDVEERLAGREAVTAGAAGCRDLWSHLVGLLDRAQARPDLLARPGRLIEHECVRTFLGVLDQPSDDRTARRPSTRALLVRRAEDYMWAHPEQAPSVIDLCREFAVSERTLHYAFREVRGLSPMAYFKAARLNAARQELKAAARTATVHEIARRWGVSHSGEFAAAYRRLFGELPSQTLNG